MNTKEQGKWNAAQMIATITNDKDIFRAAYAAEFAAGWTCYDTQDVLQWVLDIQNKRPVTIDGVKYTPSIDTEHYPFARACNFVSCPNS